MTSEKKKELLSRCKHIEGALEKFERDSSIAEIVEELLNVVKVIISEE